MIIIINIIYDKKCWQVVCLKQEHCVQLAYYIAGEYLQYKNNNNNNILLDISSFSSHRRKFIHNLHVYVLHVFELKTQTCKVLVCKNRRQKYIQMHTHRQRLQYRTHIQLPLLYELAMVWLVRIYTHIVQVVARCFQFCVHHLL